MGVKFGQKVDCCTPHFTSRCNMSRCMHCAHPAGNKIVKKLLNSPKKTLMTNKLEELMHQQCIPASISVHCWMHSLSPHKLRCRFDGYHIRISSHPRWIQLWRDELNGTQRQAVHRLLSSAINVSQTVEFICTFSITYAIESGLCFGLGLDLCLDHTKTSGSRGHEQGF